jgi:hypothetical protein
MITDFRRIIDETAGFVDEYWFENLKLRPAYKPRVLRYIRDKYPGLAPLYSEIYDTGAFDYWSDLSDQIDSYCEKNGVTDYRNFFRWRPRGRGV